MPLNLPSKKLVKSSYPDYESHLNSPQTHLVSEPVKSITTIDKLKSGPLGQEVTEHPGIFNTKNSGCLITFGGSRTYNLGNYESAKVEVSITIPCDPESINCAYEWGKSWADSKIDEVEQNIKGK